MNINDILEVEQKKYCYEQAYALHRHREIPALFLESPDTHFSIAGDAVSGYETIRDKFCEELYYVSPNEDSFHTGWQICVPYLEEGENPGEIRGIFPTFGYLVLSMDPETMKPPYAVLSTLEMWIDRWVHTQEGWKIRDLFAQFMLGQCIWKWDTSADSGLAVRHLLKSVPHPFLGKEEQP